MSRVGAALLLIALVLGWAILFALSLLAIGALLHLGWELV